MQNSSRGIVPLFIACLIAAATLAGLFAAYRRFHAEALNRRVEIALDWAEVSSLAQSSPQHPSIKAVLDDFKAQDVTTLVISEDTLSTLEQSGAAIPTRIRATDNSAATVVAVNDPTSFERVRSALQSRGLIVAQPNSPARTIFRLAATSSVTHSEEIDVPVDYLGLRTLGLGLSPEAVAAAQGSGLRIAGRIGNFSGVTTDAAANVLRNLSAQGATTVIFNGDEVLGYRGLEKPVATMLGAPPSTEKPSEDDSSSMQKAPLSHSAGEGPGVRAAHVSRIPLTYGAVEFGKQKGDEKIGMALRGEYVRVHSIQAAEMGTMDESEAIDRFVRAVRERNIRFCFVRLFTFAGDDPIAENVQFVRKITRTIQGGANLSGGELTFGAAHPFAETGVPKVVFGVIGLGTAAGIVWMFCSFCPVPEQRAGLLLAVLSVVCAGLAMGAGEMGRKLVALFAGIAFPAAACLKTFPRNGDNTRSVIQSSAACITSALRGLLLASAITALGIIEVIGLLATRPFMLRANQFLGIKAQHAVPVLLIAFVATVGGVTLPGETWTRYKKRIMDCFRNLWDEPIRIGLMILGLVAIIGLLLVVARTGNDPGVGVSGIELKARAILDRVLPVRPRTKEFLIGHPAFLLGLSWWLRGRRKLAIPCFVVGSLGQVSLLNTFCHIHTPLLVSAWRDAIGLVLGAIIGAVVFFILEKFLPSPQVAVVASPVGSSSTERVKK